MPAIAIKEAVQPIYKATNNVNSKALSRKQLAFIDLYDGNLEQTALKAGYSKTCAKRTAIKNMHNNTIRHLIEQKRQIEIKPLVMDRIKRQEFWTKIILDEAIPIKDRLRASELLGKSEGDFLERVDLSGETTTRIKITRLNIAWEGEQPIETDIEGDI